MENEVLKLCSDDNAELVRAYPFIFAWGNMMHSLPIYIEDNAREAKGDCAPYMAVFKGADGRWVTLNECHPGVIADVMRHAVKYF